MELGVPRGHPLLPALLGARRLGTVDAPDELRGEDFIAAQDQAIAAIKEALMAKPENFAFFYGVEVEDGTAIGSIVLAHPEFVVTLVPLIMGGMATHEPTVEPPDSTV